MLKSGVEAIKMMVLGGFACLGAGEATQLMAVAEATAVRSIGNEPQLLVDDALLAGKTGVVRKSHPCRKLPQPVLESAEPWEQDGLDQRIYVYGTVLRDGPTGPFRMWYNRESLVMYATSSDGLAWQRPSLGLCEYRGSKQNNIVFPLLHSPSVVYNPRAEDPEHRYNMLGCGRASKRGYCAAHSADGLQWSLYPRNPVLPGGDTCTLALDPATGEYLAFHKRSHMHRGQTRRLVYLATSRDMQHWSEPKLVMAPDEIDDAEVRAEGGRFAQFYNMSVFPYGGQFLGLVTHFRFKGMPTEKGPLQSSADGPIDVQLVHSRDGRVWSRCEDRSPVIPNGPHAYDAGCILGVANGPLSVGQELWLYYTAITTTHGGYVPNKRITIALAKWRLDGLVSLGAGQAGGVVETVPLRCAGDRLVVNADAGAGALTVAVLDEHGRELPGYAADDCLALRADSVRSSIRWKDHDRLNTAGPLRLRFHLRNARLFSYAILAREPRRDDGKTQAALLP
jgi:hypothetical protein